MARTIPMVHFDKNGNSNPLISQVTGLAYRVHAYNMERFRIEFEDGSMSDENDDNVTMQEVVETIVWHHKNVVMSTFKITGRQVAVSLGAAATVCLMCDNGIEFSNGITREEASDLGDKLHKFLSKQIGSPRTSAEITLTIREIVSLQMMLSAAMMWLKENHQKIPNATPESIDSMRRIGTLFVKKLSDIATESYKKFLVDSGIDP